MKTRIRELQKESKLLQEELAIEVGTTRKTISLIKAGKYTVSLSLVYKIINYFELKLMKY
jgi:Predicted transcriptional regulators